MLHSSDKSRLFSRDTLYVNHECFRPDDKLDAHGFNLPLFVLGFIYLCISQLQNTKFEHPFEHKLSNIHDNEETTKLPKYRTY